jgi:hypothetical protein
MSNNKQIKNGDVFDIGQTVNGVSRFLWFNEVTMNDKIKHLLATAYKTDSIEKNKWRIENREQRREQRKKELKELMEKFKYQYGFISLSISELNIKLNELGCEGWDISTIKNVRETNEFDSEGKIRYRWEIFMKMKIQEANNQQQ